MELKFGKDRARFIKRTLDLAFKELILYDWCAKVYWGSPSEDNKLTKNDKVKLFIDGTVMGINMDWVCSAENEYEVCSELWYYVRKMYQHLQVRRREMKGPRGVHDNIIMQWAEVIGNEAYMDSQVDITSTTEIDAHTFKYYMLAKHFDISRADMPEEIADEIVERLGKEYYTFI